MNKNLIELGMEKSGVKIDLTKSEDIQKNFEIDIQNLTDEYISKADKICSLKEKEILTV